MKSKILIWLTIGIIGPFESSAWADQMYGIFMITKGTVTVKSTKGTSDPAKVGMRVYEGDTIITSIDSRAKIVMNDRNVINVNPDTILKIDKYRNEASADRKNVEMNLLKGKVRNNVEQSYDGEKSKFIIKTPTAVAGVRGTQFLAGYNPSTGLTNIVTFKGAVVFSTLNVQGQVIGSPVVVKKGETTSASPNTQPEPPRAIPNEELKKLDVETASAAPAAKESKLESKKEISEVVDKQSREPASEVNKNDQNSDGRKEGSPANPIESKATTATSMIDKTDVDVGQARDIKIVKDGATLPLIPLKPPIAPTILPDSTKVSDIIRETTGSGKVIINPEIKK